jgi:hypothetical protein
MGKVWRYDLVPDGGFEEHGHAPGEPGTGYEATVEMPRDAEILSYNLSTKGVSIYALTEGVEGADARERTFVVAGNDWELPDGVTALQYRSTAKVFGGVTAHVFETTAAKVEQ